ncbi:MAG TPA: hypothetical protein VL992_16015 [Tepidisphaeraceae bacterium]|nr:hypothetical protein [Tepidisphaeraceae bacterium]
MRWWLAIVAVCLAAEAVGCSSSSSSLVSVPLAVPALSTPQAKDTTYVGLLAHVIPGHNPQIGWRLRNMNAPGNLPIDVRKVAAAAQTLNGKWVLATAHSGQNSAGQLVLVADSLTAYNPQ